MKRIPIQEVGVNAKPGITELSSEDTKTPPTSTITTPVSTITSPQIKTEKTESPKLKPSKKSSRDSKKPTPNVPNVEAVTVDELPPPPKTSVQFMLAWSQLQSKLHYKYLEVSITHDTTQINN